MASQIFKLCNLRQRWHMRQYTECRMRVEALQSKLNQESRNSKLELVLFQDALLHLIRISRC